MSSEHNQVMVDAVTYFEFNDDDGQSIGGPISEADGDRLRRTLASPPSDDPGQVIVLDGLDNSRYWVHRRAFDLCSVCTTAEPRSWPEAGLDIVFADEAAAAKFNDLDIDWLDVLEGVDVMKLRNGLFDEASFFGGGGAQIVAVPERQRDEAA